MLTWTSLDLAGSSITFITFRDLWSFMGMVARRWAVVLKAAILEELGQKEDPWTKVSAVVTEDAKFMGSIYNRNVQVKKTDLLAPISLVN